MKKVLLGLSIAILAFLFGVLTANIFVVRQNDSIFLKEIENDIAINRDVPLFSIGQLNQPEEITPIEAEHIYGWYSFESYSKMPEINMILLSEKDDIDRDYAGIFTNLSDDIDKGFAEAIKPIITIDKVKFETKKVKGISYRFEGHFFKNKTTGNKNEGVLRGTLQKFIKGKKVAEISDDFAYSEPYCLH